MSEAIGHAPPPAAAGPPPGPKMPTTGTLAASNAPSLHGAKATGGGDHQKGGASRNPSGQPRLISSEQGDSLLSDYASVGAGQGFFDEKSTIHATISHWLGESEPVRLSAAQLTEFKTLLNRHRPLAMEKPLERNAYIPNEFGDSSWLSLNGEHELQEEFLSELDGETPTAQLFAAVRRPYVDLPPELAPQSSHDEARLFRKTTDPRAGFAPEGIAIYVAAHIHGVHLTWSSNPRFDFVDEKTQAGWHVAPVRNGAARPIAELQAAVAHAEAYGANLLLDATHLMKIDGPLGTALKEILSVRRAIRIVIALGPTRHVFAAPPASA